MQKKTIALAVAGLMVSGAALAQSNVTLYGRADIGYVYSKSDYKKFQGIQQGHGYGGGGSHVGVRGEEALGNGLKAVFRFEWGVDADNTGSWGSGTNANAAGRYSYVGLAGKFGTVTLGRDQNPADRFVGVTGSLGFSSYEPINRFREVMRDRLGASHAGAAIEGNRWGNSIAYISPNFSGLDFAAIYSFGEKVNAGDNTDGTGHKCINQADTDDVIVDTNGNTIGYGSLDPVGKCKGADTTDAAKFGLGVRYANGPLYLTAVYQAVADDDSKKLFTGPYTDSNPANAGYGAKGWSLGGAYDFNVVKVYANYLRLKANHNGRVGDDPEGGSDKQTAWSLGVGIPVSSAGTVAVEYARYKDYRNGAPVANQPAGHKAKGYSLGYKHVLSKRTSLYTYLSRIDNDRGINASVGVTSVSSEKQTNFTAGIVHLF